MEQLKIAGRTFNSRLMIGTGKFSSPTIMEKAIDISGAEIVTVALRRVDFNSDDDILKHIDLNKCLLLPNTAGARDADEAIRLARLSRVASGNNWVKLEVTPNANHLLPDPIETLKAATVLTKEGFNVMPYINADPILAKHLEDIGCVTVMPLASPIGTNKGMKNKEMIKIIIENANVPVVVDAGIGLPSHASEAMEIGASAVLINTAIAVAEDPIKMAEAFKYAVISGYLAKCANPPQISDKAVASSPIKNLLRDIK